MDTIIVFGAIQQGLIYGIMAIGVYLTFRILNFPDLTVDGSFALGGAVAATLIVNGIDPWISTFFATIAGALAGSVTGLLHTKGKINGLLAGILTMIALYSINLRVMGKANVPLLGEETALTFTPVENWLDAFSNLEDWQKDLWFDVFLAAVLLLIAILVKLIIDWFLKTDLGMAIRATGDNPTMILSFGANTDSTKMLGLILSNALVGMAGGLMSQYQGFADVQMGIGMIVVGLASVIIGEVVFGSPTIGRATLAALGGGVLYRLVIAIALYIGLNPSDMKLITALLVIFALTAPRFIDFRKIKWVNGTNQGGGNANVKS